MPNLEARIIDVWYLHRRGRLIACGLSEDDLYQAAPSMRSDTDKEVTVVGERFGIAHGEVLDWTKRGGHSFNPKLHWDCPQCGQQWWEDFVGDVDNPLFAGSGCKCVAYWLVHWEPLQVTEELANG